MPTLTPAVLEKIIAFLAPLFLIPGATNSAARDAAADTLASYGARTDRELRFAALSIAFSFGALEALSKAADPDLPLNHMLRLRGNANALNRAAQQNEARLEKLQKQPPVAEPAEDSEPALTPAFPASSATGDLLAFARSQVTAMMPSPNPASVPAMPQSRQQRRAAERKAEKIRQRQQEEARRAQSLAALRQPMQLAG